MFRVSFRDRDQTAKDIEGQRQAERTVRERSEKTERGRERQETKRDRKGTERHRRQRETGRDRTIERGQL